MKKNKEPSLFRKIVDIHHEQAMRRRALRYLEKQAWSIDFLSLLLVKAGNRMGEGVELVVTDKNGVSIRLSYNNAVKSEAVKAMSDATDIFDRLDDEAAVESFIAEHSTR